VELHPVLLIFELRRAAEQVEHTLISRVEAAGWPAVTINQVLLFAHLDPDGVTPAELARRMGMSRQSMQKNLERLHELDLVTVQPHPTDRRSSLVTCSEAGHRFSRVAAEVLDGVERRLEAALGSDAVNQARNVLAADLDEILRTSQNARGR
jgi:DNA-binding MarR family transcriptional regulator